MSKKVKDILIIGLGSIGQRHYRNLKKIDKNFNFFALRKIKNSPELSNDNLIIKKNFDLQQKKIQQLNEKDSLKKKFDAVFICNPSSFHIEYAYKFAKKGTSLFIEKPLSHNLNGINKLKAKIRRNKIICALGFQLRHHKFLHKIKNIIDNNLLGKIKKVEIFNQHFLPYHHKYEDYRISYAAKKKLGGGVLLCFIHEIDYAIFLFQKPKNIICKSGSKSNLDIDVEDFADLKCEHFLNDHKFFVNIHLDFIKKKEKRNCRILFQNGEVIWNLSQNILEIKKNGIKLKKLLFNISRNALFKKQLENFIENVNYNTKPISNIENGISSLEVVMLAKKSSKLKKKIFCS